MDIHPSKLSLHPNLLEIYEWFAPHSPAVMDYLTTDSTHRPNYYQLTLGYYGYCREFRRLSRDELQAEREAFEKARRTHAHR